MKYEFEKSNYLDNYKTIITDFIITKNLKNLLNNCKGIEKYESTLRYKYKFHFNIGNLFDMQDVEKQLSKILDAYIASNQSVKDIEDKQLIKLAKETEQFNFLKNYLK